MALAIDGLLRLPCVLVLLWRCTGGDVVVLVGCCGGGTTAVPDCPTASTPVGRRVPRNPGDSDLLPKRPTLLPRHRRDGAADATPASPRPLLRGYCELLLNPPL
jgi:hypothetical protein